jgi:hypothetical protein
MGELQSWRVGGLRDPSLGRKAEEGKAEEDCGLDPE